MVQRVKRHDTETITRHHNASITRRPPHPPILFPAPRTDMEEVIGIARVREFTGAFLTPGTKEHDRLVAEVSPRDLAVLKGIRLLRYAAHPDSTFARQSFDDAMRLLEGDETVSLLARAEPAEAAKRLYKTYLTPLLSRVRLVVPHSSQDFVPALRCPDMKTALYCFTVFSGCEVCPNCLQLFSCEESEGTKYCSPRCGAAYRQRLYRLRQPKKKKKERKEHE